MNKKLELITREKLEKETDLINSKINYIAKTIPENNKILQNDTIAADKAVIDFSQKIMDRLIKDELIIIVITLLIIFILIKYKKEFKK